MERSKACAARSRSSSPRAINVGDIDRTISIVAGGAILLRGLSKLRLSTIAAALAGGALLYRGLTGHCGAYQALDISTADGRAKDDPKGRNMSPDREITDA